MESDISPETRFLEKNLDNFDPQVRRSSLKELHRLALHGEIMLPPEQEIANLHCHTFFSYNGYGYSPTHIAWLGKKMGAKFMGIVDFDVLDGVDEFLDACEIIGLRGTAGMETRVFVPEYADMEVNSPGEPGISYHMGIGFVSSQAPAVAQAGLQNIRSRATERNRQVLGRLNAYLAPLSLDYERDILPQTPNGNATERHIVTCIVNRSAELADAAGFWSQKLGLAPDDARDAMRDGTAFQELVRRKLIKRGSVGYVQPTAQTFPLIDEVHRIVMDCEALPCVAWLDGTSPGEKDIRALLDLMTAKGCAAINIVPDRNWNIADPESKVKKLNKLYEVVQSARDLHLPIAVGTEMNSYGQREMDDFNAPELAPVKEAFLEGAYILYAHTQMQRIWGMGYQSSWANQHLGDRSRKNEFYLQAGRLIPPFHKPQNWVARVTPGLTPFEILQTLTHFQEDVSDAK